MFAVVAELLLMNSVRGCGTLKRLQRDGGHFTVERLVRRPSREPLLDLLQQPTVAVGLAERGIRGVGTPSGIWTRNAHLDAVREELAAGRVDVLHRQDLAVDRARLGGSDPLAEDDRTVSPGSPR